MNLPRIDIDILKIAHNVKQLKKIYTSKGINIIGVTKVIGGNPLIASILVKNGITILADSRIINIKKMKEAGILAQYLLLRTPSLSQVKEVIDNVDISLNSELVVLKKLSKYALKKHIKHKVILMIELGDLREGVMPSEVDHTVREILKLKGLCLIGIGANLACLNGISPSLDKMNELSSIAIHIERKFKVLLHIISGGNSANYQWFKSSKNIGRINNLRIGESIFLGRETLSRNPISGLFTDIFTLITEVIESKLKPSMPYGEIYQNVSGIIPAIRDRGFIKRAILNIGLQDTIISGIIPKQDIIIIGASSDHIIVDNTKTDLKVGDTVEFTLNYEALLRTINSPYITKNLIH